MLLTLLSKQGPPPVTSGNPVYIKIAGTWLKGQPWVKISGIWKQANAWVKVSGVWKQIV